MALPDKVSIVNRALQRIGAQRITSFDDDSVNASEASSAYDRLRQAELRRNAWRFAIRNVALRPYGVFNQTKLLTFATWSSVTTYAANDVVTGSDGLIYYSNAGANLNHDPSSTTGFWTGYFGPLTATEFVAIWGSGFTYAIGDHSVGSDGFVYSSLVAGNINHNPVGDADVHWSLATTVDSTDTTAANSVTYYAGELVFIGAAVFLSLQNGNSDVPPSAKWLTLTAAPALAIPSFIYPIGTGPVLDTNSRNVFHLPNAWLCEAAQNPNQPSWPRDWLYQGAYLLTRQNGPLVYRFVTDITAVPEMDALFIEGFGARIGFELCQRLSQDKALLQLLAKEYDEFMADARLRNAIENGPTSPEEDEWVTVKITGGNSPYAYT